MRLIIDCLIGLLTILLAIIATPVGIFCTAIFMLWIIIEMLIAGVKWIFKLKY